MAREELTFTTHVQNAVRFNMAARKRRFTESEKKDIADIICNEEMASADGLKEEPIVVKLKAISNKDKAALYKIVCDKLVGRS